MQWCWGAEPSPEGQGARMDHHLGPFCISRMINRQGQADRRSALAFDADACRRFEPRYRKLTPALDLPGS